VRGSASRTSSPLSPSSAVEASSNERRARRPAHRRSGLVVQARARRSRIVVASFKSPHDPATIGRKYLPDLAGISWETPETGGSSLSGPVSRDSRRAHGQQWRVHIARLTPELRARADDCCELCGEPIDFEALPRSSRSASVDHIIPVHAGVSIARRSRSFVSLTSAVMRGVVPGRGLGSVRSSVRS
jgi:hypothetical protein